MGSLEGSPTSDAPATVARWLERARELSATMVLGSDETRDLVPELFDAILAQDDARRDRMLGEHLGVRVREGYQLSAIVEELAALTRGVAESWAELAAAQRPSSALLDRVLAGLQRSVAWVTATFDAHMRDDEQRDKRIARQLESETRAAIHRSDSLETLARGLLSLVLEGMQCEASAILLYDTASAKLVELAVVGPSRETLEREVVDLTSKSFPAEVARAVAPATEVEDITTSTLDVSPSLRASGIHAMLGVRLPARSKLFGVLYVGAMRPHAFSSREIRRLEMLGERLLVHLATAHLCTELRATVDALRAERATRETFVSLLVHDLRTPLSNAKVSAQLLAKLPADHPARIELTNRIERNVDRADLMLRDLLDVSRIRAGGSLPVELAPTDLADVVSAVVSELSEHNAARMRLQLEHVCGSWDRRELERALGNLVANALKHGDPHAPMTIRTSVDGDAARLSVHNEGAPIDPAHRAHVFEPFVQKGERQGWGLGLALVRACALAHGGRAFVESNAEHGTTFTIELPIAPSRVDAGRGHGAAPDARGPGVSAAAGAANDDVA